MTDNIPATELLPCPFCGGTEFYVGKDFCEDEPTRWYALHVRCQTCYAKGRNHYQIGWCESEEAAREAWNDRIRAETAKNSGEVVAWETHDIQIDGSPARTFSKMEADDWIAKGRRISRYFYATPANSRAEAIGECVTALEADAEEFGKLARRELGNVCANARATILDCCDRLRSLIDKEGSK